MNTKEKCVRPVEDMHPRMWVIMHDARPTTAYETLPDYLSMYLYLYVCIYIYI